MTTLDFVNAPLADGQLHPHRRGQDPAGRAAGAAARRRAWGRRPGGGRGAAAPPIGQVLDVKGGLATMQVVSDTQKTVAMPKLPKTTNAALKHDAAGVLGLSGPNTFYLTLQKNAGLDRKYTALGKVIAGLGEPEGHQEGRRDPQHPHHARRPGRARLQDGRRGVQEADGAEEVASSQ